MNRILLSRSLRRRGYRVLEACDGVDALAQMKEHGAEVDAITMDAEMPQMDGRECVRRLRAEGVTIPIVGVTGNALSEDRQHFLSCGVDVVLPKPVVVAVLVSELERLVDEKGGRIASGGAMLELIDEME